MWKDIRLSLILIKLFNVIKRTGIADKDDVCCTHAVGCGHGGVAAQGRHYIVPMGLTWSTGRVEGHSRGTKSYGGAGLANMKRESVLSTTRHTNIPWVVCWGFT